MDGLIPEFIDETIEGLSLLDNDLVRLEVDPSNTALLDNAFRVMHTIKGTCGFIGLPRLEKMAHAAENLMEKFRSGALEINERAMTVLFMSVDRVRYIVTEIQKSHAEPEGKDDDLIALIEQEMQGGAADSASAIRPDMPPEARKKNNAAVDSAPAPTTEEALSNAIAPAADAVAAPVSIPAAASEPSNPALQAADTQAASRPVANEKTPEFLRVHMHVLEELVNKASELVLTRNQLMQLLPKDVDGPLKLPFNHLCRLVSELQDSVMKARMQPIGDVTGKFPRLVRDLSAELKKKITLEVVGEETELDRQVLDMIKDPLTHMLRNACDHGIETPKERVQHGKPEQGHIRLHARHEGGFVVVTIADDGRGLDPDALGRKAIEKGLVTEAKLADMSRKEVLQLIMAPGFSTAQQVTNVSGRGVGMDVVRANIEKIGGLIEMESTAGKGSTFTIHIPLTLAIIPALIVGIDGLKYAIPQLNIQEVLALDVSGGVRVEAVHGTPVLRLRERIIPLLNSDMLFSSAKEPRHAAFSPESLLPESLVVVVNAGSNQFGLILDTIHDTEEVVIKSLSPLLRDTGIFAGNTILGDGQVVMILDPAAIARRFHIDKDSLTDEKEQQAHARQTRKEQAQMLIFRAGDETPKTLPLELVSRVQVFQPGEISRSGTHVVAIYQKTMIPLSSVEEGGVITPQHGGEITAVILADDMSSSAMGIVIDDIIGVVDAELELATATARPGVLGSLILNDGMTADVLDITHYLRRNNLDWFSQQEHQLTPYAPADELAMLAPQLADSHAASAPKTSKDKTKEKSKKTAKQKPADAAIGATVSAPVMPVALRNGKRVLIVDDSSFFRNMLYPILRSAGYEVSLSHDPLQAIARHDKGEMFDIILSDIEMPHMSGYEFVEKMREPDSAWRELPFIAITSHNTPEDILYGRQKGFDEYIGKFDKAELIRAMHNARRHVNV